MRKLTTNEFIEKSIELHKGRYDYSSAEYINGSSKVLIICNEHGDFYQRASAHLEGQGCIECRLDKRKIGLINFLTKSNQIHSNRYDYSLVDKYVNSRSKVSVICLEHGIFEITPNHHINRKQGCSDCKKLGLVKFVEKSNEVHSNRYDYSSIDKYVNNKSKVEIICSLHGIFSQRVSDHISGVACPKCSKEINKVSIDEFINRSNFIHYNRYKYSKSIKFNSNKDKIEIYCENHGKFRQRVDMHLRGQGCPKCRESKGEIFIRNYLQDRGIEFVSQKKFSDCKYKKELLFDFYLPNSNICIEYNGLQHYESVKYFGGINKFNEQKIRDKIKNEYCKNNNIHLITIKYDEIISDILHRHSFC